jgi:hypothetical protein
MQDTEDITHGYTSLQPASVHVNSANTRAWYWRTGVLHVQLKLPTNPQHQRLRTTRGAASQQQQCTRALTSASSPSLKAMTHCSWGSTRL